MCSLEACRVCLSTETRLFTIADSPLQEMFEKITNSLLLNNDGKPLVACYICRHFLEKCYCFSRRSVETEEVLQKMLDSGIELSTSSVADAARPVSSLTATSPKCWTLGFTEPEVPLKLELTEIKIEVDMDMGEDVTYSGIPMVLPQEQTDTATLQVLSESNTNKVKIEKVSSSELNGIREITREQTGSSSELDEFSKSTIETTKNVEIKLEPDDISPETDELLMNDERFSSPELKISESVKITKTKSNRKVTEKSARKTTSDKTEKPYRYRYRSNALKDNTSTHEEEYQFNCKYCGKGFKNKKSFVVHVRLHGGEEPYRCNDCRKKFKTKSSLNAHLSTHRHTTVKRYFCDYCHDPFLTKELVRTHIFEVHQDNRPYRCNDCNKKFKTHTTLAKHKKIHANVKPFVCELCGHAFLLKSNLANHMQSHSEVKSYRCRLCSKAFRYESGLKYHIMTHTGEKPYVCNHCGKSFILECSLKLHVATHTGEKLHRCSYCGKGFLEKYYLKLHTRTHTGEKPYSCDHCGQQFSVNRSLSNHIARKHTDIKPYRCDRCDKTFAKEYFLKIHGCGNLKQKRRQSIKDEQKTNLEGSSSVDER